MPIGLPQPVILAGGLSAANVQAAIEQVRPYAVDVSGGVEAEKELKMPPRFVLLCRQSAGFESGRC